MDYANGKIYTIRSYLTDKIYIGSTTQSLTKRWSYHKQDYKGFIAGKQHYISSSFDIIKFGDAYIELLEECPCNSKEQICKREGQLIREYDCVNKNIAGRTRQEWYRENREHIRETTNLYYQNNKEYRILYNKQYYNKKNEQIKDKIICACGGQYTFTNKHQHLKTQKHKKFIQPDKEFNS